jgi:hypothetical protein
LRELYKTLTLHLKQKNKMKLHIRDIAIQIEFTYQLRIGYDYKMSSRFGKVVETTKYSESKSLRLGKFYLNYFWKQAEFDWDDE